MRQDRFLIGILAGIGVLIVVALAVFFIRRDGVDYGPEDTPEGVVSNYVVALQRGEYERAYGYLASFENKPDLGAFRVPFDNFQAAEVARTGLDIQETTLYADGKEALVALVVLRGGNGPFDQGYRETNSATLVLEGGAWKIRSMPYPFWSYEWDPQIKSQTVPAAARAGF